MVNNIRNGIIKKNIFLTKYIVLGFYLFLIQVHGKGFAETFCFLVRYLIHIFKSDFGLQTARLIIAQIFGVVFDHCTG